MAAFFKALADGTRLAIVRLLALTDLRAGELVERVHAPQNAVSYHLRQLRSLGLLRDRRSGWDARDVYYSLDLERLHELYAAAGNSLHPGIACTPGTAPAPSEATVPLRVLFLCTHNSARSQLAEAIARQIGGERVEVYSAGSKPAGVHPLTVELMGEWGMDPSGHTSKPMDRFAGQRFHYAITVCDRVREGCPVFPGDTRRIHWSLPDPLSVQNEEERREVFCRVRQELLTRIRYLLSLPHPRTGERMWTHIADGPGDAK
ncbi:MAG: metalloregulator ArsR/SmtB family transcription factor [Chloroflexota bacterium]|nr:metalloregulator ArsR/SmtB family transcription factor [Chloroflexota bacterium]